MSTRARTTAERVVSGTIETSDGAPLRGATVVACVKRIRHGDQPLGRPARTDERGHYTIKYQPTASRIDLYLRISSGKRVVGTSPVVINAGPVETIDVVLDGEYRGTSDFERLERNLARILEDEGVKTLGELADLDETGVALLSAKSGIEPRELVLLRQSVALANETTLPAELFYALGKQKLLLALPSLLAQDSEKRRAALMRAIEANQIPARLEKDALSALRQLDALTITDALRDANTPGETTLGTMLSTAGLSPEIQRRLIDSYVKHTGTTAEFWDAVRTSGALTAQELASAQFALQLGALTQNHAPLVRALQAEGVTALKDLATFDKADWRRLVSAPLAGQAVGTPPDLAAAGVSADDYAEMLYAIVEDAFPTAMVARRVAGLPDAQPLATFFEKNPGFDMRTTPVAAYLRETPQALDAFQDADTRALVVKRLKGIERTYRLAPKGLRMDAIDALVHEGLDSAQKIRVMGPAAFVRRMERRLGRETAETIFQRANNASATAAVLLGRHAALFDRTPMAVLPSRPAALQTFADYQTLFGSLDFCSCEHCLSVYGPSAYTVDLLHWLDNRPSTRPGASALDELFDNRRADLGTIELSCQNTNTALPYIDLVNERLELTVSPLNADPAYQTRGSTVDLLVHPEHLHTPAYELLAGAQAAAGHDAVYPFNLPFNLWLTEARTYLGQLGVPRHVLMEAFHATTHDAALIDVAVCAEVLEMSPLEWEVIAQEDLAPARSPEDFWGMSGAGWVSTLTVVSRLLDRAAPPLAERGMEFEALKDLLKTDFIQAPSRVGVWFEGASCDTTLATLPGLDAEHLARMHRLIRLGRTLGWSASDVDRAIATLGAGALDASLLVKLANVRRIQATVNVNVPELLTWWGPLDTRRWAKRLVKGIPAGVPAGSSGTGLVFDDQVPASADKAEDESQYDRLFQSRSVAIELTPAFHVRADGRALVDEMSALSTHAPAVIGALGLSAQDLEHLLPLLPDDRLSLANLSALYRHASLARATGTTLRELVSLLALTGLDPFDAAHPENALELIEQARALRESGFTIAELDYILREVDTQPASLEPADEPIGVLLLELRDALRKIDADLRDPASDATADELREELAKHLAPLVTPAVAAGIFPDARDAVSALLAAAVAAVDVDPGDGPEPNPPPANTEAIIDGLLAIVLDSADARTRLAQPADAAYLRPREARLRYVLQPLVAHRRRVAKESIAIEKLSTALGLDAAIAAPVLRTYLLHPGPGGVPALEVFTVAALADFEGTAPGSDAAVLPRSGDLPDQFASYKRLHKLARVLARLLVSRDEVAWMFEAAPATGVLDLTTLPIAAPNPAAVAQFAAWNRLRDAFLLRDRVTSGRLFDLFAAAAAAEAGGVAATVEAQHEVLLTELEKRTRWNRADIEFLVGTPARGAAPARPSPFGLPYPGSWKDERTLERIAAAMRLVRRIGLAAETLWPWSAIPAALADQRTQADAVKQAVRGRYQESEWRAMARPLRDGIRDLQRQALAGWLIAHDARFADAHALFEHFLLDVAMSPCRLTSRIKQAISSVQLFVQRALMDLEPNVRLTAEDALEWKWMKSYRVWEANRKVFLYPENWIEPELRDDKTPFYRQFESELLQNDVTAENVEQAVLGYLEKLDDVARLEVAGLFHHKEDGVDILHVFARTRGTPARYFYRRRLDGARWTPWEKVDIDIEGDHLLAHVFNRRLYIFWAQMTEAAVETVPATPLEGGDQVAGTPIRYYQIRLGWSEHRNGGWTGKKVSAQQIGATYEDYQRLTCALRKSDLSKRSDFFFHAYEQAGDLLIEPIRYVRAEGKKSASHYERLDRFRMSGCDGTVTVQRQWSPSHVTMRLPVNAQVTYQTFARPSVGSLTLPGRNPISGAYENQPTLQQTPTGFEVVTAEMSNFASRGPFFFQDLKRSFFVEPADAFTWLRQPPAWTLPDRIPLDILNLAPEMWPRPLPPSPDPWAFDRQTIVTDPSPIELLMTPALTSRGGTRVAGLPAAGAAGVMETFGAHAAYIGGEVVVPRSNKVAIRAAATLLGADGQQLLTVRSAEPPNEGMVLRSLNTQSFYTLPPLTVTTIAGGALLKEWDGKRYRFDVFYHPYVCRMMRQLNRFGIDGLWDPSPSGPEPDMRRQLLAADFFDATYAPISVSEPFPRDDFDFTYAGAYALYNWELFFHVPFSVACFLTKNQRFDEAQRWFHYIFNPTESDSALAPQRFWKIRPFFELFYGEDVEAGPIHELLLLLHYSGSDPEKLRARDLLLDQIAEWRRNPFNPHAIARLRVAAYQKAVVMRYITNLIEWGDQLFRRDTLESINEATQLYVLASQILGRRPREVSVEPSTPRTFNELRAIGLDQFSNALIEEVESYLPEMPDGSGEPASDDVPVLGPTLFFCLPPNDRLITEYWDKVADRLFKVRHCMNIEGIVRQLPLFEPPLDPALLVRAAAAGIDLASALNDVSAPLPYFRYQVLSQKAGELCADVRALGQALLTALEKKDAEALALTRAGHESKMQTALVQVRVDQVREAKETLEGLKKAKENAAIRQAYYQGRTFISPREAEHIVLLAGAHQFELLAQLTDLLAASMGAIPGFSVGIAGFGGSPNVTMSFGGENLAAIQRAHGVVARGVAGELSFRAQMASLVAGYERRADDWQLQGDIAKKDAEALDRQILAAEIRVAIAERELENLNLQIDQSKQVEDFLRTKYTNGELYSWMVGQISALYFQSYKLAYDLAKRAERAWQFELAIPDRTFIQFGYWDGLKKGLLAGDRLHYDIKRMECAHLDAHRREYELSRQVSLRELDSVALVQLRRTGECIVRIPEAWFDLDSPGHYMRRIKSVAVSIPSVTGPYVPVRCTLTLLSSRVRTSPDPANPGFRDDLVGIQSIVTSRAQEDSGLFETSFQDPRYLPFEGAGAVSEWRIELPKIFRQFDYETIADVVLHVRYTARDGGKPLRDAVESQILEALNTLVVESQAASAAGAREGLFHLVSARRDFPDEWQRFLHPTTQQQDQSITIDLTAERFPYAIHARGVRIAGLEVFLAVKDIAAYAGAAPARLMVLPPGAAAQPVDLRSAAAFNGLPHGILSYGNSLKDLGEWAIQFREADNGAVAAGVVVNADGHVRLNPSAIGDLIIALRYKAS